MTIHPSRRIWLVAGEDSGDQLGAKLMRALSDLSGGRVTFGG
ncbi:MAG: lipid-A-disaccharide synthase, partial [Methylobacterium sp.]|nr:lipid-A-disaccharide synthase [Methylobacterium sp.]